MKRISIILMLILSITVFGKVLHVFYSYDCDHCEMFLKGPLQELLQGEKVTYRFYEVTNTDNMNLLYDLEDTIGRTGEDFPEVIFGDKLYYGNELGSNEFLEHVKKTKKTEPELVELLKKGTYTDHPSWEKPRENQSSSDAKGESIYVAYFFAKGCSHCNKTDKMLENLKKDHNLVVDRYELPGSKLLLEAMEKRFRIPEKFLLGYPKLFIRDRVFYDKDVAPGPVTAFLKALDTETEPWWRDIEPGEDSKKSIIDRFGHFSITAVITGGLIDGINPCAFTTILFFISFLTLIKRTKKEVLITGIAFCTAIFLSYLLIGMGLVVLLRSLSFMEILSKILYLVMGIIVLVFAVLSFYDYFKFKAGKTSEATLQLPGYLKKMAHKIIRKGRGAKNIWISAFVTGILISLVEFACTGQVYLPTITFVMKVPELRVKAFLYLVIYNLFFILPLILVFILAYMGFSSKKFNETYEKMGASVKLITGIFFLVLGGLLIYLSL